MFLSLLVPLGMCSPQRRRLRSLPWSPCLASSTQVFGDIGMEMIYTCKTMSSTSQEIIPSTSWADCVLRIVILSSDAKNGEAHTSELNQLLYALPWKHLKC